MSDEELDPARFIRGLKWLIVKEKFRRFFYFHNDLQLSKSVQDITKQAWHWHDGSTILKSDI